MKNKVLKSVFILIFAVASVFSFTPTAIALTPNFSVVSTNNGQVSVTVTADPNSAVILDYYSGSQLLGAGVVGYTNQSGYFSGTLNASSYAIPVGAQTIVVVNGQQSSPVIWPANSYNGGYNYNSQLTLSVTTLSLVAGQSQSVSILNSNNNNYYNSGYNYNYNTTPYTISNSGNNVVTATVSGNIINVYGVNPGTATLTVCGNGNNNGAYPLGGYSNQYYGNNGCVNLLVTVTGSNYYNPYYPTPTPYYPTTPTSNNVTNVQTTLGGTVSVSIAGDSNAYGYGYGYPYNNYNTNSYYIQNNNASTIATTSITGNTLVIYGNALGSTPIVVCATSSNQCATVYVTVVAGNYNYNSNYNYPYGTPIYSSYNGGYYNQYGQWIQY